MAGMKRMLQTPSSRKKNSGRAAAWAPAPLENNDGKRGQLTRAFANPWEMAPQVPAQPINHRKKLFRFADATLPSIFFGS
jgi:hypothetical protein